MAKEILKSQSYNKDIFLQMYNDNRFFGEEVKNILHETNAENIKITQELLKDKTLLASDICNTLRTIKDFNRDILRMKLGEKIDLYHKCIEADKETKALCKKYGLDIDKKAKELALMIGTKRDVVKTPFEQQKGLLKEIIANNNPVAERTLREFDFAEYKESGLPLKYTRDEFNAKVNELIKDLSNSISNSLFIAELIFSEIRLAQFSLGCCLSNFQHS